MLRVDVQHSCHGKLGYTCLPYMHTQGRRALITEGAFAWLQAVQVLHDCGLVHSDLKAENARVNM